MSSNSKLKIQNSKLQKLVPLLLNWFSANARDLPWRRTRDPYAIWVSEIMLQQTQVKTVIPYWKRWMRELPTIEAVAKAHSNKIHKLWEGLGYYTRARNLQKAARQIVANRRAEFHDAQNKTRDSQSSPLRFPQNFDHALALPGIGRYTAGAICSIAFNQPTPVLDGNVIRVLTRVFGIEENPKMKEANERLWDLAELLVASATKHRAPHSSRSKEAHSKIANSQSLLTSAATIAGNCSALNQSLMELGALVCASRNPQCDICPVKRLCVAFREGRVGELPNLGKREAATARHFVAFVVERNGRFLARQRPAGVVNAHLWEFPNVESSDAQPDIKEIFKSIFGIKPAAVQPLCTVKHSITRYRITLEAFRVPLGGASYTSPHLKPAMSGTRITRPSETGVWLTPVQMRRLAFTAAHRRILRRLHRILNKNSPARPAIVFC